MGLIVFDTHAFVKRLTDAGMPEPQAEVRRDLKEFEATPRAEITTSGERVKAGILKGMFVALLGQTAVLAALVKLPWPRSGKPSGGKALSHYRPTPIL